MIHKCKNYSIKSTFRRCTQKCHQLSQCGSSLKISPSFYGIFWAIRQINSASVYICGMWDQTAVISFLQQSHFYCIKVSIKSRPRSSSKPSGSVRSAFVYQVAGASGCGPETPILPLPYGCTIAATLPLV